MILAVDIGTSTLKVAYIDFKGRLHAFHREPYPYNEPVRAETWEITFFRALKHLPSLEPAAICISGNGPTLVPVNAHNESGSPLFWYGNRTPTRGSSFFLAHIAYFRDNEPDSYKSTRFFLSAQEWLAWRLGAEPVSVLPAESYRNFYWDAEQCDSAGIDPEKLPPFVSMGTIIGKWDGVPIAAGNPDFVAAIIGTGTTEPGIVCDRAGTSEGINLCIHDPVPVKGLRLMPSPVDGLWNLGGVLPESGSLFESYRKNTGQQNRSYEETLREIMEDHTENAYQGRAVLEKIAAQVRGVMEQFQRAGFRIQEMRISGGQAKSPVWNQLKSTLTNCTILVPEVCDGELAGDAVVAALALGIFPDLDSAVKHMIRIEKLYRPQQGRLL
ncbi:sugar kinase [Spirochaetia bacterium]|nr:sugar kinase [Spirochaetia bacterium]